jgi:hypothetical protein
MMVVTTVYLRGAWGWRSFHGSTFTSLESAQEWALGMIEGAAVDGCEIAIAAWEQSTGDVLWEGRSPELTCRN